MNLTDLLASAVQNPQQRANGSDLGQMFGMLQGLGGQRGVSPDAMQSLMSVVGQHVRGSLRDQRNTRGEDQVNQIVDRYGDTQENPEAVNQLFSPQDQTRVAEDASQRTGLPTQQILALLPIVVPMVLKLLRGGQYQQGQGTPGTQQQGGNPLLTTFLDSDRDGDVDLGDTMKLASSFLRF